MGRRAPDALVADGLPVTPGTTTPDAERHAFSGRLALANGDGCLVVCDGGVIVCARTGCAGGMGTH
jgi:hypothetical protein